MAPTTTKTTRPKVSSTMASEASQPELAQQFKTARDYTTYVVARMQQADPNAPKNTPIAEDLLDDTETEVRPRKEKRVKGRRRVANPVANIEAALRRQAELKSNFRNLARPLKQVLNEMAQRTTDSLESDPHAHEGIPEHAYVRAGLQNAQDKRRKLINRGNDFQRAQLNTRRAAEEEVLHSRYNHTINNVQDSILDGFEHRMLQIERQSRLADATTEHDTEDEDDVILQPHTMSYRYDRGSTLAPEYDSRSRLGLAVDDAQQHLNARNSMRDMLQDQDMEFDHVHTIMDPTIRDATTARRQGIEGMDLLARASQSIENEARRKRRKHGPILLTQSHDPLMELANAATKTRDTLANDMPPPETPRQRISGSTRVEESTGLLKSAGRKRTQSVAQLSSPFMHDRPLYERSTPVDVKAEPSTSPASGFMMGPRSEMPLLIDERGQHGPSYEGFGDHRYDRQSSVMSHTSVDQRSMSNDTTLRRDWNEQDRYGSQHLASPFLHNPIYAPGPHIYPDYDGSFRPMDFGPRHILQHPPRPPTAQPIDHFANSNMRGISYSSSPYSHPPPPAWSSISATPLVALPQGDQPRTQQQMPFFNGQPFSSHPSAPQMTMQHNFPLSLPPPPPQNQYGGPMLAPAAGPYHTPQPAFAQQIGRQEQSRRRNTEGAFPRFREYRGPT